MKALVKSKGEPGLWLENVAMPSIQDNEVLVKIKKTAICGTDLHIYNWDAWAQKTVPIPLTTGHEFMGEIAQLGKAVSHLKIGERVSGEGHLNCGRCRNCREEKQHLCWKTEGIGIHRNGACAEYLSLPADHIIPLPNFISDEIGTILDPIGNAVHTTLMFDLVGEDVLITGAGPIGLIATAIAKQVGARFVVVTDVNENRLSLAKGLGATLAINVAKDNFQRKIAELNLQEGFTVGLEVSGQESALHLLLQSISHGGSLALLGLPDHNIAIDWNTIIFKGLTIQGIYGRKMYQTWDKMLHLLQSGLDVSSVITHRVKAEDYTKAFELIQTGKAGKVILEW